MIGKTSSAIYQVKDSGNAKVRVKENRISPSISPRQSPSGISFIHGGGEARGSLEHFDSPSRRGRLQRDNRGYLADKHDLILSTREREILNSTGWEDSSRSIGESREIDSFLGTKKAEKIQAARMPLSLLPMHFFVTTTADALATKINAWIHRRGWEHNFHHSSCSWRMAVPDKLASRADVIIEINVYQTRQEDDLAVEVQGIKVFGDKSEVGTLFRDVKRVLQVIHQPYEDPEVDDSSTYVDKEFLIPLQNVLVNISYGLGLNTEDLEVVSRVVSEGLWESYQVVLTGIVVKVMEVFLSAPSPQHRLLNPIQSPLVALGQLCAVQQVRDLVSANNDFAAAIETFEGQVIRAYTAPEMSRDRHLLLQRLRRVKVRVTQA